LTVDIWPGGPAHRPSPASSDQFDCSAGALFSPLAANCVAHADRLADETYWPPCLMLIKALSTSKMGFIASCFLFSSLEENANRSASIVTVAGRWRCLQKRKNHWSIARCLSARHVRSFDSARFAIFSIRSKRLASRPAAHPLHAIRSNWQPTKSMKMASA
jgi:hypothetical protein